MPCFCHGIAFYWLFISDSLLLELDYHITDSLWNYGIQFVIVACDMWCCFVLVLWWSFQVATTAAVDVPWTVATQAPQTYRWSALVVSTADVNANCLILLPPTYRAAFAVALGCGYCCDADKLLMLMHLLFCSNCCFRIFSHRMELMFSYRGAVILFSVLALSSLNVLSFFHRCWTSNVGELYPLGANLIFHRLFLFDVP